MKLVDELRKQINTHCLAAAERIDGAWSEANRDYTSFYTLRNEVRDEMSQLREKLLHSLDRIELREMLSELKKEAS